MKIAVFHPIFSTLGGGEKVVIIISNLLKKSGYDVTLFTLENQEKYIEESKKLFGLKLEANIKFMNVPLIYRITKRFFYFYPFFNVFSKMAKDYDLKITTQSNPDLPVDIIYVQSNAINRKGISLVLQKLLRLYYGIKGNPKIVISVSSYTAKTIKDVYGLDSLVIHPPVNVEEFLPISNKSHDKNLILTLARLHPSKKLDFIIKVAKELPELSFIIVGTASNLQYLTYLNSLIKELNVKNVEIKPNLPKTELLEIMSNAKLYLHPPVEEPNSLSVVESMAAGLIPVVYKKGGTWSDVVSKIDQNLGYDNIDEAKSAIYYGLENRERLRPLIIEEAKKHSVSNFEEQFIAVVKSKAVL